MPDAAIKSGRVITPHGVINATVLIKDGKIADVSESIPKGNFPVTDVGNAILMPGILDPHVHINEPGRTEWEGFDTATRAAIAGGITTLVDMPLNSSPATTTVAALEVKRRAAEHHCWVNTGFIGGVVPGNARDLESLHE